MNLSLVREIEYLQSRNNNLISYQKELEKKRIRYTEEVSSFCKRKGIANTALIVNTLKYFEFNAGLFTKFDVDLLHFVFQFTYFNTEDYKCYLKTDFSRRQLRELKKMSEYDQKQYDSSVPWKEMKIRNNYKKLKLYDNAQIFVKVKEELMLDYIKFLGGRR